MIYSGSGYQVLKATKYLIKVYWFSCTKVVCLTRMGSMMVLIITNVAELKYCQLTCTMCAESLSRSEGMATHTGL